MADYAVIILTHMARDKSSLHSAQTIADKTGLGLPTVSKILKLLARGGILVSARGSQGGYSFARDVKFINAAEIIEAVDGPISVTECADNNSSDCSIESLCPTRMVWHRINNGVRGALAVITLAELIEPAFAQLEKIS